MSGARPRTRTCNVLVIGSGAAGLRAAIAATQAGADVLVIGKRHRLDAHTVLAAGGINAALGTRDYYRVRFGIGRPPGRMDPAAYVLKDFSAPERKDLPLEAGRAADAVEALITKGLTAAQNEFHPPGGRALPRGASPPNDPL